MPGKVKQRDFGERRQSPNIRTSTSIWLVARGNKKQKKYAKQVK